MASVNATPEFRLILRAAVWMLGAVVSFSAMAVAGRFVSSDLDTFEIMLYRSVFGIFIVLAIGSMYGTLGQIRTNRLGLHAIRNLAHFSGQNLWLYAVATIPLVQVFALEFTTPIWVILLAPLVLGERITRVGLGAALLSLLGVVMVTRPWAEPLSFGMMTAAAAAVGFALSAIFTRKLTRDQSITCILFWLTVMQAIFGLATAGYDGQIAFPAPQNVKWILLIGAAGLFAHFCLTTALSLAPASVVMPIDFIRLPLIAFLGSVLFRQSVDQWVFFGAVLIFGASYLNIMFGQPNSSVRRAR